MVKWALMVIAFLSWWVLNQWPDEYLHLVFCDVGQGDAILVVKKDFQMVIDTGPKGERLLGCLGEKMPFWDRKIEVVVNTHQDMDHIGGLDDLLERFEVDRLIINGVYKEGEDARRVRQLVKEKGVKVIVPAKGDVVYYTGMAFEILWPEEKIGEALAWQEEGEEYEEEQVLGVNTDVNQMSIVGILDYLGFEALLTGDIGIEEEEIIIEEGLLKQVEILKIAHHGSKNASSQNFLDQVEPKMGIIQVGKNSYGHPSEEVLERLEEMGIKILRTDKQGTIEIITDGSKYWLN